MALLPLLSTWQGDRIALRSKPFWEWFAQGRRLFLLFIPLALIQMTLKVAFPGPQNLVNDWARLLFMLVIFFYGVLLFAFPGYRTSLKRNGGPALILGTAVVLLFIALHFAGITFSFGYNPAYLVQLGLASLATWCWLIAFVALARRCLNFSNPLLAYANEAVLPFYILHQTVIIGLGFPIINTEWPLMVKYAVINLLSFLLTVAIYDTTVKRLPLLRYLFGMRAKKQSG